MPKFVEFIQWRKKHYPTQQAFGDAFGVSQRLVSNIEDGTRPIAHDLLKKIELAGYTGPAMPGVTVHLDQVQAMLDEKSADLKAWIVEREQESEKRLELLFDEKMNVLKAWMVEHFGRNLP